MVTSARNSTTSTSVSLRQASEKLALTRIPTTSTILTLPHALDLEEAGADGNPNDFDELTTLRSSRLRQASGLGEAGINQELADLDDLKTEQTWAEFRVATTHGHCAAESRLVARA